MGQSLSTGWEVGLVMFIKLPVRQELGTYCVLNMVLGPNVTEVTRQESKQGPAQDNQRFTGTVLVHRG